MQSYAVFTRFMFRPYLAAISFTNSSYTSGAIYVWNSSDTPTAQHITPAVKHVMRPAMPLTPSSATIAIEPSSKRPYSIAVMNEKR